MNENNILSMWTVYDRPTDYPNNFVAREWHIVAGDTPPIARGVLLFNTLEELRADMEGRGLVALARFPDDDPKIVESWL